MLQEIFVRAVGSVIAFVVNRFLHHWKIVPREADGPSDGIQYIKTNWGAILKPIMMLGLVIIAGHFVLPHIQLPNFGGGKCTVVNKNIYKTAPHAHKDPNEESPTSSGFPLGSTATVLSQTEDGWIRIRIEGVVDGWVSYIKVDGITPNCLDRVPMYENPTIIGDEKPSETPVITEVHEVTPETPVHEVTPETPVRATQINTQPRETQDEIQPRETQDEIQPLETPVPDPDDDDPCKDGEWQKLGYDNQGQCQSEHVQNR